MQILCRGARLCRRHIHVAPDGQFLGVQDDDFICILQALPLETGKREITRDLIGAPAIENGEAAGLVRFAAVASGSLGVDRAAKVERGKVIARDDNGFRRGGGAALGLGDLGSRDACGCSELPDAVLLFGVARLVEDGIGGAAGRGFGDMGFERRNWPEIHAAHRIPRP